MDGNQIKIFINLEVMGEEDKTKKNYKMIMMWQVLKRSIKSQRFWFYLFIQKKNFLIGYEKINYS